MRTHYRLEVELTLLGPILTRGGMTARPGIDAPVARDGYNRPMLPFSLIKGKVRDAFRALRPLRPDGCPAVVDWLGTPSSGYGPERGRLRFSDFVTEAPERTTDAVIERIAINQDTGSTAGRMLAMIEAPFGYGQEVTFRGAVEFIADGQESRIIKEALDRALRWVPSYGGLRTVGFGRTQDVKTNLIESPERYLGTPVATGLIPVRLRFDRPLCLVGRKHSGNHFETLETVSGAVLKGAMARLILEMSGSTEPMISSKVAPTDWPKLCQHFESIRFTEARPMASGATHRPVQPPLSIATAPTRKGEYFDVALQPGPVLIAEAGPAEPGHPIKEAAPAFDVDWKDAETTLVRKAFGWPDLPRERRTRTAIDEYTGRAKDEMLFSYGLVLPEVKRDDGTIDSFVWEASIGLEHIPEADRQTIADELVDLLKHGLPNVGKTRAVAMVEWLSAPTPAAMLETPGRGGNLVVTLQTDFLMTDPKTLGDGRPASLEQAYRDFWLEASREGLSLVRYFARQALHGGFLSKRWARRAYQLFLVTERGSTFVLETIDADKAAQAVDCWRKSGLPVPSWVGQRYGNQTEPLWMSCPFLPHVGFGEVAIDLECHARRPEGNTP